MNIKRNIVFALEKRKKNGVPVVENVPIRMRVIYHHKRIEFTTGYRIDVSKWDDSKQRVKNGSTNKLKQTAAEINSDLLKYYSDIQDIFKECEVNDIIPNPEQLKAAFNNRQNKDLPNSLELESPILSFMDKFDEFVRECGVHNNWTEATYEKFATTKKHLEDFDKNLTFESWDENKLTEFVNYLRDKKSFRNSTAKFGVIDHLDSV
ncbi:phage integrase SAM-like domain-containing protein [Kaistella anthropi]|nr:phage integrase SAM-like domain-containing protein [Kaistella anthropi]